MKFLHYGIGGLLLPLWASSAIALEPFKLYDNFNAPVIDQSKYAASPDRVREISGNKLRLLSRDVGGTTSNAGTVGASWSANLANPPAVNAIRANLSVTRFALQGCAANPDPSVSRIRVYGDFFNTATPTPGSQLNDVSAQVRITRASNSGDPPNVLRVEGIVLHCHDATCLNATTLGSTDFGIATLGQVVRAQLQWDKSNNRFLFSRDGGTPVAVNYAVPDASPPGLAIANAGLRNMAANCTGPEAPSALIEGTVDDLAVNRSAAP